MKKLIFALVLMLVFTSLSFANIKGAFIDWQLITESHPIARQRLQELEKWASPYREQIEKYENQLMELEKDFRDNIMASERVRREKEENYNRVLMQYQSFIKDFRESVMLKEQELLPQDVQMQISSDLLEILESICESEGFNVIYDRAKVGAIYVNENIDITKTVLELLKKFEQE
jgi:Skp family chaperone for outer membrane proteins